MVDEAWTKLGPLVRALYSDEALDAYPRLDVAALIRRLRSEEFRPE